MRDVGTTNKTHLRDYEGAMNENTAAVLRVNPSTNRIIGFSTSIIGRIIEKPAERDLGEIIIVNGEIVMVVAIPLCLAQTRPTAPRRHFS